MFSVLLIGLFSLPASFAQENNGKSAVLIGFKGIPDENLVKRTGGDVKYNFHPFINALAVNLPESAISGLSNNPNVSYIEPDSQAFALGEYENSWGVDHIEADLVHPTNKGTGTKVAVIDTGINYNHPDLAANYVGGYDFVNGDSDPLDDNGHGTHVSGTVAAVADGIGVIGTSPEVSLYGLKVLDSAGSGSYSDITAAIQWSAQNDMQIASLSLGGSADSQTLHDAIIAADNVGVLIIAAAGNDGNPPGKGDNMSYPAKYSEVISVGATDQNDNRASFSSTGDELDIMAPGVSILSTYEDGYATASGTSMATPHVSGVAALVFASDGTLTNSNVKQILLNTADDLGPSGWDSRYGYGLVDADGAVATEPEPANELPTVIIESPSDGSTFASGESISFTGSASDTEDGDLTNDLSWTSNIDGSIGNGGSFSTILSDGEHTITASVTDFDGATGSSSISIVVGSSTSSDTASIDSINYTPYGGKNSDKHLDVVVHLTDGTNNVSDASVTITLTNVDTEESWSGTTITDSEGNANFSLKNAPSGCYETTVNSISADGYEWDGIQLENTHCKTSSSSNPSNR